MSKENTLHTLKDFEEEINEISEETGGELAIWLHNNYESISKQVNWKTQKECRTDFNNLPKENQSVMLRLAQEIQVEKIVPFILHNQKLKQDAIKKIKEFRKYPIEIESYIDGKIDMLKELFKITEEDLK